MKLGQYQMPGFCSFPLNIFYPEGSGQTFTVSEKAVQNGLTVN